jgi:hypothetical protein
MHMPEYYYGNDRTLHLFENSAMKKILGLAASVILVIVSANAQSEKKEPPPPPPKPKDEVVKLTP